MDNQPLFSILIANYNNANYLEEAILSVYKQTYGNWEIIIVDDCSTDNSKEIYQKYISENRIKIFFNLKNGGCGYTKRQCVEKAKGDICGFLDPDDKLVPDAIQKMINLHQQKESASLICSNLYICDEDLNIQYIQAKVDNTNVDFSDPYFFNLDGNITHFATFKKSLYEKTAGIDSFYIRAVDEDLYLKLSEVGDVYTFSEPLYYYRIHEKGISKFSNAEKASYWHWAVISDAARRRYVNPENLFTYHFVNRHKYNILLTKYDKIKKYEKLSTFMSKVKSIFKN